MTQGRHRRVFTLSHDERRKILQLREQGIEPQFIAARFGISKSHVIKICMKQRKAVAREAAMATELLA